MKPHKIDLADFQKWREIEEVMFANSTREKKRLVVDLHGNIKVLVENKVIWQGTQPFAAVEFYNSITEKIC